MKDIILWFVSGYAFFVGCFFILLGIMGTFFEKNSFLLQIVCRIVIILGFFFAIFSGAPISGVLFRIMGILALALFFSIKFSSPTIMPFLHFIRILIICCACYLLYNEYKYWNLPYIPRAGLTDRVIYLLGDSISSGINFPGEEVWAKVIEKKHNIKIYNLSVKGATITTAIQQSNLILGEDIPLIIEIGGNDIRRRNSVTQFGRDLDALLKKTARPGRVIIMFEIPTPPLYSYYIKVQRELAKKYGVYLIPKRYFASLILGEKNTVDSVHLSNHGHKQMADLVWKCIKPLFDKP